MAGKSKLVIAVGIAIAGFAFARARVPERSYDIWWHLATGRWIVEHHAIPTTEPFSYTAYGVPWIAHEWLADLGLYALYRAWGHFGLSLFRQLVAAATCVSLYLLLLTVGIHPLLCGVAALFSLALFAPVINARPQFLMPLLLLGVLHAIYRHRAGRRGALWAVPLITLVWVNVHGGFLLLFAVLALYAFDRLWASGIIYSRGRRGDLREFGDVVAVGFVTAVATLANPHGLQGAMYPLRYVVGDLRWHFNVITEYASPDFSERAMTLAGLAVVGLIVIAAWVGRSMDVFDGLAVAFFTHSFLKWQRMVGVFGIVAAIALVRLLAKRFEWARWRRSEESAVVNVALVLVGVGLLASGLPWLVPEKSLVATESYPARALEVALHNGVKGHLLNTYRYGGYILWRCYPRRVVFIDGRADTYPRQIFDDCCTMLRAEPGWQGKLRQYDIAWVLMDRKQPLAKVLRVTEGWHLIYADKQSALFVRDGPPNEELLAKWRRGRLWRPPADFYAK